jgi:hypothetical protein
MATQSMPLFVDPQEVILRLQLDSNLTGITDVIASGIIGAQLHVERIISGQLARQVQDARYYVDSESFSGIAPNGTYRLEIPSGFVRSDVPVLITSSLPNAAYFEDLTDADMSMVRIEAPRGYVHLDQDTFSDCHVRVQCETGFDVGEAIPYDVAEAIMSLVGMILAPGAEAASTGVGGKRSLHQPTDPAFMLLQPYIRTKGFSFRPA